LNAVAGQETSLTGSSHTARLFAAYGRTTTIDDAGQVPEVVLDRVLDEISSPPGAAADELGSEPAALSFNRTASGGAQIMEADAPADHQNGRLQADDLLSQRMDETKSRRAHFSEPIDV
jgi:hypothetical protein